MNIAITGANGFIGQAVIKRLGKEDVNITTFDKERHNLLDSESLKSFVENQDVIIHLAGVNRGTSYELIRVNTLGMLSFLEAVVKYNGDAKVVFASTFQVYLSQSLYGLSKKFAEDLLAQYALNHKIKSTILRLSNVYGPGGKPFYNSVIATFAHQAKLGETLKINGDGSQERDYVYVGDAVDAFAKAALYKQKTQTEVVDICSGQSTSLKTLIETMRDVYEKGIEVVYNEAAKENPWPIKDKNFEKAKELLGWEPKTSLSRGLKEVMK